MKKQCYWALPFLLATLWLACKKDPPPEVVAGYVREYGSNKPIVGAQVLVSSCRGSLLGPTSCAGLITATTNEDGYYEVLRPEKTGAQIANAMLPGYFTDLDSEVCVCDPSDDTDIVLYPHAWLKVKVVNESGAWGVGCSQLLGQLQPYQITQAQGLDSTLIGLFKGNKQQKILFYVLKTQNSSILNPANVTVNDDLGNSLDVVLDGSLSFKIVPKSHDTTNITITY
jgi:hypothetical protein